MLEAIEAETAKADIREGYTRRYIESVVM